MDTIIGGGHKSAADVDTSGLIRDVTTQSFAQDVLDASMQVPVIVDFWAPWCGPCKQLTPVLERVVTAARGAVRLAKMNIDDYPEVASQLRVQSIPAVFAFKNGQPVDGFMGALPESQVRAFVERLTGGLGPSPAEELIEAGDVALEEGALGEAAQLFAQAVQEEPGHPGAVAGLARCYLLGGDFDRARQTLGLVRPDGRNDPGITAVEAQLALAEKSAGLGDLEEFTTRIEKDPKDHEARFNLALALNARGDKEAAVSTLLASVEIDRNWNDQAARKQLVEFFDAYGPRDEVTLSGRRRLSSILFS
ncbi:MAG: thioredoxin [Parvibaculaceae bacterium]|nr:thioredoxin [Parvibaculaceae bacterium]